MMRILLIEDETAAAKRISKLIAEIAPDAEIAGITESIRQTVQWLTDNDAPDLIVADIQLADGISLSIFNKVNIHVPIIFATAYDEYTLKAFKLNSIDYLLKPIDKEELRQAFDKYKNLKQIQDTTISERIQSVILQLGEKQNRYKMRFMVKLGDRLITVPVSEMDYVVADYKVVQLYTSTGYKYIIDETLEELEKSLDPMEFFRINRSYIVAVGAIEKSMKDYNGKLKVTLRNCNDNEIYVSRSKTQAFKEWLNS